jgi:FLVCR family MFS transporter 7
VNIGAWFNFLGAGVRVLSALDLANGTPIVPESFKYSILMLGQCLCAFAQPFIMFVATKFANNWFADDQRALANTIALGSNIFGILIGSLISPIIVNNDVTFVSQMCFLHLVSFSISLFPAVMACFITRSTPPTPPSFSAIINIQQQQQQQQQQQENSSNQYLIGNTNDTLETKTSFRVYLSQVGKLLKSKDFLILFVSFGLALGLFNTLSTLIEQILCTRGYTDEDAGIFGGGIYRYKIQEFCKMSFNNNTCSFESY